MIRYKAWIVKKNRWCARSLATPVAYGDGVVYTNTLENYWSLFKRGIHGTYVSVEPFHLARYLDEQAFRYNNRRDMTDGDRLDLAVCQIVGKRLTYAALTGKNAGTKRTTKHKRQGRGSRKG